MNVFFNDFFFLFAETALCRKTSLHIFLENLIYFFVVVFVEKQYLELLKSALITIYYLKSSEGQ